MAGRALRAEELRRAVRFACAEMRQQGMHVERLIILLKELWNTLPSDGDGMAVMHARDVFDQIVHACIEEYYAPISDVAADLKQGNGTAQLTAD